jgi:hypothetical protein
VVAIPVCPPNTDCIPWCIDTSCCTEWATTAPAIQTRAAAMAWATLKLLTGGRLGSCAVTMRPCLSEPCNECTASAWMTPQIVGGCWVNSVCGGDRCSCQALCEVIFPGPVAEIVNVSLDGITIDDSLFRIDNGNRLVRMDGGCWPSCQQLGFPLGTFCTFGITYVPGIKPDTSALLAAGILACEFAKSCSGVKCRLPAGATTVARQGVVIEMSNEMWPGGFTGIREVDAVISVINPNGLTKPSSVWSPDLITPRHRFTTWVAT